MARLLAAAREASSAQLSLVLARLNLYHAKEILMSMLIKRRTLLGGVAALLGAAAMPSEPRAQTLERVRFLTSIKNMDESYAPAIVAKHVGFFREEGLEVEFLPVGGSNEVALQIGAGNGDIGAASPGQAIVGMQPQINLAVRYFYDMLYSSIWLVSVPVDSSIKALADLRGKKLGVTAMGTAGTTFGSAYVKAAGLDPATDVTFISIGGGAQAMTAVRQGMVDGLMFWDTAGAKFEANGLRLRNLSLPAEVSGLPDVSLLAQPETLQKRPRMVTGMGRALAKGYDFCIANPEAAVRIVWKSYPESRPANIPSDQALNGAVNGMMARLRIWNDPRTNDQHGLFLETSWKNLVTFLQTEKMLSQPVPLERVYTNEFIAEINRYDRLAVVAAAKNYDTRKL
jgi:NitT/TauT family transport system substrate-binding protein